MSIEFLSKKLIKLVDDIDIIFEVLLLILLEKSIIFVAEDIETLTTLVMSFNALIKPFSWPYILIPNLPLDLVNILETPAPYLIGILMEKDTYDLGCYNSIIITCFNKKLEFNKIKNNIFKNKTKDNEMLKDLSSHKISFFKKIKDVLNNNLLTAKFYEKIKDFNNYDNYCQKFYKSLFEQLKTYLADDIELTYMEITDVNN